MRYINYDKLRNITKTFAPYRGSLNRYPWSNRKQSYKYFIHEKTESGDDYFRVVLGKRWKSEEVTKEVYNTLQDGERAHYGPHNSHGPVDKYIRYFSIPNELGIVRPDNTFEFTSDSYGQGERMIMTSVCNTGYFMTDCRRVGDMYVVGGYSSGVQKMLPIFKGLRVDCDTMTPVPDHEYKLYGHRVNRKNSKEFIKQYDDFFKVAEVMMKSVKLEDFVQIGADKVRADGLYDESSYYAYAVDPSKVLPIAKSLMLDDPLEAAALFCIGLGDRGVGNYRWLVSNYLKLKKLGLYDDTNELEKLYPMMRRAVCNMLYRENPDVLERVEFEFGKPFPASTWGYVVEVDGKEVNGN